MKITKNVSYLFNIFKDCQHLLEQLTYLNYNINEYQSEKDKLIKEQEEMKTDKFEYVEKLEREIKGYKNMIDSCVKTCSQLAEELMLLKKEIEKYTKTQSLSTSLSLSNLSRNSSVKKLNPKISHTKAPSFSSNFKK
jgi:chromosome segregation ATPase